MQANNAGKFSGCFLLELAGGAKGAQFFGVATHLFTNNGANCVARVGVSCSYVMANQNTSGVSFSVYRRAAYRVGDLAVIEAGIGLDTLHSWIAGHIDDARVSSMLERGAAGRTARTLEKGKGAAGWLVYSKRSSGLAGSLVMHCEAVTTDGKLYSRVANAAAVEHAGARAVVVVGSLADVEAGLARGGKAGLFTSKNDVVKFCAGLAVARKSFKAAGIDLGEAEKVATEADTSKSKSKGKGAKK